MSAQKPLTPRNGGTPSTGGATGRAASPRPPIPPGFLPPWQADGRLLHINEIFYSIEGEGIRVGEPTTFVRLAHCNLRCPFCDTEFDTCTVMDVEQVCAQVQTHPARWVCLTGGEPLGQNITLLARRLKERGYRLHIETNGTLCPAPELFELIEHWTVSPKRGPVESGFLRITELKYVVGETFREDQVQEGAARWIFLQPESSRPRFTRKALDVLTRHPTWRLSCRIQHFLGLR